MADRRKPRKNKEEIDVDKTDKVEYSVAKYIRSHVTPKKTTLINHKVEYFKASEAIDCLLDSPWAKSDKKTDAAALFTTRDSVIEYMNIMLHHKFFHRALKIPVEPKLKDAKKKKLEEDKKKKGEESAEDGKDKKGKKSKKSDKKDDSEEKKKEKRKVKLDMHLEQIFKDGSEVYVWIYDPIPTKAWVIGGLLVIGAIIVCLFPLWPQSVRKGVYYLSIAAAGFLIVILTLAVVRLVAFCLVWMLTMGKHHVWLLPNLTEDVGFLESFWPLYKYEYRGSSSEEKDKDDKEGKDKSESKKKGKKGEGENDAAEVSGGEEEEGFEVVDSSDVDPVATISSKK